MEIKEISFFDEFKCMGGSCPATCCEGWLIPLDSSDVERFASEKGLLKMRLMGAMSTHSTPVFNPSCGKCPFHTRSGLCELQLNRGHDFLPDTCRTFPRFYRNYGIFEERYIDLSCVAGAKLFLEHLDDMHLIDTEGEPDCEMTVTNDDTGFLKDLTDTRSAMISALLAVKDHEELSTLLTVIDDYALTAQSAFLKGKEDFLRTSPFGTYYSSGEHVPESGADPRTPVFPLSSDHIRSLMNTPVYSKRLKKILPDLYRLFKLYFGKYYLKISIPNEWQKAYSDFMSTYPEAAHILAGYYAYYLYRYFLKCFEDYSFVKHIRVGFIHLSMILVFLVIRASSRGGLSTDDYASVISLYDRRAYFNDTIIDRMYETFESEYPINSRFPL